jgi:MFS family permease
MPDAPAPLRFKTVVGALAMGQLLSWAALYYAFSSFVLPMMHELGWSKSTLMGAFTLGLGVWGACTYAAGAAIDRGRGRAVMTAGSLLAGLGFVLWSRAQSPVLLYAAWAVLGAAMAMTLYEPAFTVLTKRYPLQYRQGITALTLVGGFASTVSFPLAAWLIALLGWRDALLAIGLVPAFAVAPLHAWCLQGRDSADGHHVADAADDATLHQALREPSFWLLTVCFTLYSFASAALWAHVMPAFAAKGMDEPQALSVLVWIGPAQVAGRLLYVGLGRHVPLRHVGLVVLLGMPAALLIFALAERLWPLLAFAFLFGVANGLVTIVRGGLVPEYFGRTHVGRIGGAMSAMGLLARAAAPLFTAWMLLVLAGYTQVMLVLAGLGLAAAVAFALARPPVPTDRGVSDAPAA